jgi:ABC-2 type transport system ATP-binding protein
MRIVVGLDAPSAGAVIVNGKPYAQHASPLREVGIMLEARAMHTGRSARNHLLALAATHGIGRRRVNEAIDMVGLLRSPTSGLAASRWAWGSGSALRPLCSGTRIP